ncbi:hypothetical protein [Jannaschia seohaensis]|uniref:Uncharacterized protein n=1 Tax=Jannaschia seohaensis TaxID=475081 RepID=A0A2Y9B7I7_9RHOB|nr:hypothetical protein [Jannaschia seohaensis]PWJ11187.1 hypothetical protein BCF38_12031 [Jannaschia seohaensis]SSA51488.1 hypothetical protein SAMN05421539_12031 [Jannaschia seohaensis]
MPPQSDAHRTGAFHRIDTPEGAEARVAPEASAHDAAPAKHAEHMAVLYLVARSSMATGSIPPSGPRARCRARAPAF